MNPKTSKKVLVVLGAVLIILIGALAYTFVGEQGITGEAVKEYKHTRAVCDEDNFCEDYEITCEGEKVTDISPTGFTIQNPDDWKDPRSPEEIEQWCNVSE